MPVCVPHSLQCPFLPFCPHPAACLPPGAWGGPAWGSSHRKDPQPARLVLPPDLLPLNLRSYLAIPASSWVDDFIDWLTPSSCCRIYTFGPNKDQFCPSTVSE